ncbi:hypothetical protein Tco_0898211 [Tanacetum coccineum]
MTRNMKYVGKFLKTKCDFDILNDESDGEGSIQVTNKTETFVELKNKYRENFLVDIEKAIKTNGCESRAKIGLVSKSGRGEEEFIFGRDVPLECMGKYERGLNLE